MSHPRRRSRAGTFRLVLLSVAVVSLFLLVVGLPRVELDEGVPFQQIWQFLVEQFATERPLLPYATTPAGGGMLLDVYRTIFIIALVALPFAVILVLIDPDLRKRVLRSMVRVLLIMVLLSLILRNQAEREGVTLEGMEGGGAPPEGLAAEPFTTEDFAPERISPWVGRSLSLILAVAGAAILVTIIVRVRQSRAASRTELDAFAQQAETALQQIRAGTDLRDAVLRCYAEMSLVVREQRGIRRERSVTAREFTDYLIGASLPRDAVLRLTSLFEKARYSSKPTTGEDEAEAVASLSAIVEACRERS